jgi:ribosomal protein L4
LFYNKKNNILIIENLEDELTEFKTKKFLTICKDCQIDVNQKILLVVSRKTAALKAATQNLKDVELVLASNLNTFSFLKAKQILVTSLAINDIKEIYCE